MTFVLVLCDLFVGGVRFLPFVYAFFADYYGCAIVLLFLSGVCTFLCDLCYVCKLFVGCVRGCFVGCVRGCSAMCCVVGVAFVRFVFVFFLVLCFDFHWFVCILCGCCAICVFCAVFV